MKLRTQWVLAVVAAAGLATSASAGDLVYTPINPSFGGNPLNTTHLFDLANAQKDKTAPTHQPSTTTGTGIGNTDTAQQNFDLFVSELQGRLLSELATEVTNAIFGTNAKNSGTIKFGDQEVSFVRTLQSIKLTLTDLTTGKTTVIDVPQVVMN
jgi:curli production assembly/transport component CsgF